MLLFDDNLIAANGTVAHYGGGMSDDALSLSVTKLYPTTKDPPLQYSFFSLYKATREAFLWC